MHIMEGFLPSPWWEIWFIISLPFIIIGLYQLNKLVKEKREALPLLAVAGAFVFVLSSLKLPSFTGSCSHPTGTGLGAVFFGPCIAGVLGLIVLVFQAVFLAHGGITTLGANVFSMGIAGPAVAYVIYKAGTPGRREHLRDGLCRCGARRPYHLRRHIGPARACVPGDRRVPRGILGLRCDLCRHPGPACHHRGCDHYAGFQVHRRPQTRDPHPSKPPPREHHPET